MELGLGDHTVEREFVYQAFGDVFITRKTKQPSSLQALGELHHHEVASRLRQEVFIFP